MIDWTRLLTALCVSASLAACSGTESLSPDDGDSPVGDGQPPVTEAPGIGTTQLFNVEGSMEGYTPPSTKSHGEGPSLEFVANLPAAEPGYLSIDAALYWDDIEDSLSLEVFGPDGAVVAEALAEPAIDQTIRVETPVEGAYRFVIHERETRPGERFKFVAFVTRGEDAGDVVANLCMQEGEEQVIAEWTGTAPSSVGGVPGTTVDEVLPIPDGCAYDELQVDIAWDVAAEDLDLDVLDPNGSVVASSGNLNAETGVAAESATAVAPRAGDYVASTKSYSNFETPFSGVATLRGVTVGGCYELVDDTVTEYPVPVQSTRVIVGVMDSATNPYHDFFYAGSEIYPEHAPTAVTPAVLAELGVKPENQVELTRTGDIAADIEADAAIWSRVKRGELFWFKGTNLLAISFAGTDVEPLVPQTSKSSHGVGTSAAVLKANPEAVVILVEQGNDIGNDPSHEWTFLNPSIDIVSTSYGVSLALGLLPVPETRAFHAGFDGVVGQGKLHFSSSGNGPGLSPARAGAGPWWSIGVSGSEEDSSEGRTITSGRLPDFVSDFVQQLPYCMDCQSEIDTSVGGTSFSTPRAAGVASRVLLEVRREYGHRGGVIDVDGVPTMAVGGEIPLTNWVLRRALEEAAWVPGTLGDPIEIALDLATPVIPQLAWLDYGWGDLSARSDKLVVEAALTHLSLGALPRTKPVGFCEFQTEIMLERMTYWNEIAPSLPDVFGGDSAQPLDSNPFIFCDSGLPHHPASNDPGGNYDPAADFDGDGVANGDDNCPEDPNADQADEDGNGVGDACEAPPSDIDGDGVVDSEDNCPNAANPDQTDTGDDGVGDACESAPETPIAEPGPGTVEVVSYDGPTGITTPVVCLGCGSGSDGFATHEVRYELPALAALTSLDFTLTAAPAEQLDMVIYNPAGEEVTAPVTDPMPGLYLAQITELVAFEGGFNLSISTTCPDTGCN